MKQYFVSFYSPFFNLKGDYYKGYNKEDAIKVYNDAKSKTKGEDYITLVEGCFETGCGELLFETYPNKALEVSKEEWDNALEQHKEIKEFIVKHLTKDDKVN